MTTTRFPARPQRQRPFEQLGAQTLEAMIALDRVEIGVDLIAAAEGFVIAAADLAPSHEFAHLAKLPNSNFARVQFLRQVAYNLIAHASAEELRALKHETPPGHVPGAIITRA